MSRQVSRPLAALLFGLVLTIHAATASAEQPWKVLPPMPELPPATVAGPVHINDIEMWRAEFGPKDSKPVVMVEKVSTWWVIWPSWTSRIQATTVSR